MPAHSTLTGADLHEPKGVAAASANAVYVANGAGSGTWQTLTTSSLNTSSFFNINKQWVTTHIVDIGNTEFTLIVFPRACTVNKITTIIDKAIATTDTILSCTNSNGGASLGTITIAFSGSAEGTVDSLTPGSNNIFTADSYLKITSDGATSTTAVRCNITIELTWTA